MINWKRLCYSLCCKYPQGWISGYPCLKTFDFLFSHWRISTNTSFYLWRKRLTILTHDYYLDAAEHKSIIFNRAIKLIKGFGIILFKQKKTSSSFSHGQEISLSSDVQKMSHVAFVDQWILNKEKLYCLFYF